VVAAAGNVPDLSKAAPDDRTSPWAYTAVDADGKPVEVAFARTCHYLIKPPRWSLRWSYDVVEQHRDESTGLLAVTFSEPSECTMRPTRVADRPDPATDRVVTVDTSVLVSGFEPAKFRADDALFISVALATETALFRWSYAGDVPGQGSRRRNLWDLSTPVPIGDGILGRYGSIAFNLPASNPHGLNRTDLLCAATAAVYGAPMYTTKPEAYIGARNGLKTLKYGPIRNKAAQEPPPPSIPQHILEATGLTAEEFQRQSAEEVGKTHREAIRLSPEDMEKMRIALAPGYPAPTPEFVPQAEAAAQDDRAASSEVVQISARPQATMALDAAGRVYLWGSEGIERRQAGEKFLWTPYQVRLFDDAARIVKVSAGGFGLAALSAEGDLYLWDRAILERLRREHPAPARLVLAPLSFPGAARIVDVSTGEDHLLVLGAGGEVYAMGSNDRGQLGDGTQDRAASPVRVVGLPGGERVTQVAAWGRHSVAVTEAGRLWAWGWNRFGQLGDGTDQDRSAPVLATGFPENDPIIEAHPAYVSTTVLTASGKVHMAGTFSAGRSEPDPVPGPRPVVRVGGFPKRTRIKTMATGGDHWLAAAEDGAVWAWGDNESGQLGVDAQVESTSRPMPVTGLPPGLEVLQLAAGERQSVALATDGSMCAWGSNDNGELGVGLEARQYRRHPTRIPWTSESDPALLAGAMRAGAFNPGSPKGGTPPTPGA
jgi:alpha-tubulin suppressor-like RCC1 family protein/predicted nucleic acid-binding protein